MFEAIADRAQKAVDQTVSKIVARIAVAVPFLVASAFGTAAASVKLTEMYGSLIAYAVLAVTFAGLGGIASVVIFSAQRQRAEARTTVHGDATATAEDVGNQASSAPMFANAEALLAAFGAVGPSAIPIVLRLALKNWALILGLAIFGYLLFSDSTRARNESSDAPP